jgi:multidrug efflux pump subunit AcrA (membrane-fusion protein)
LVVEHSVHVGETASVGSTLMTVASLDVVKLTIYVPTDRIGLVRVGQRAEVTVDSFPGRIFVGQVTYISPQAEFTPKNVQTREERVKTVFAVRITLPNPDHSLKPGMSADARALADAGLVPTTTSTP